MGFDWAASIKLSTNPEAWVRTNHISTMTLEINFAENDMSYLASSIFEQMSRNLYMLESNPSSRQDTNLHLCISREINQYDASGNIVVQSSAYRYMREKLLKYTEDAQRQEQIRVQNQLAQTAQQLAISQNQAQTSTAREQQLNAELASAKNQVLQLNQQVQSLVAEKSLLQQQNTQKTQDNLTLASQNSELNQRLQVSEAAKQRLTTENQGKADEIRNLNQCIAEKDSEIQNFVKSIQILCAQLGENNPSIDILKEKILTLQKDKETLQEQVKELKEETFYLLKKISELK